MRPYSPSESNPALAALLERRLKRHNWEVAGLTVVTVFGAAIFWAVPYGIIYWISLFLISADVGGEARLPRGFNTALLVIAAGLLLLAILDRRWNPDERPRNKKGRLEIAFDFLLLPARATIAIWGNLSAWQKLTRPEIGRASLLLERLLTAKKVPIQHVPLDVPDERERDRVLLSLLLLGLAEIRKLEGELWVWGLLGQEIPPEPALPERSQPRKRPW